MITTINEWKKINEGFNDEILKPEDVKPGMTGEDYNFIKGKVIDIVPVKQWENVKKYDTSGWFNDETSLQDINIDINDESLYLVAVSIGEENGETQVYTYGGDGFVVYKENTNEAYVFDFEGYDDTDLAGMGVEIAIDDLISEYSEIINRVIDKEAAGTGTDIKNAKKQARRAVGNLWKEKIDEFIKKD